jgi:3-phosphoshikimate 1-carboxyvinyltransferase
VAEGTWIVEASGTYFPLEVDINDVPDLAPSLAAVMAVSNGRSKLLNVERLRTKESDRISTIISTLRSFGIDAEYHPGEILVNGGEPRWGEVVCPRDHRIAMLAGDLALRAGGRVLDAECVNKSNPKYWEDLMKLGGKVTTS